MLIAEAEALKKQLTDKYVVVNQSVPELRRFVGLTGRVKTVNMNGRALVEFDGPVDISWYDIDPACLTIVDAPQPKAKKEEAAPQKKAAAPQKASGGASPLEMARKQGAAGADAGQGGKKPSPLEQARQQGAAGSAPAKSGGEEKKLSPLEMARQQGAAGAEKKEEQAAPQAESGKKLSPLEMARQQGAVKSGDETTETPQTEEAPAATADAGAAESSSEPSAQTETPGSTEEIIALARKQGAFKE